MLRRLVLVTMVLGGVGLGCGLRDQPLSWDGAAGSLDQAQANSSGSSSAGPNNLIVGSSATIGDDLVISYFVAANGPLYAGTHFNSPAA